jgi:GH24 family phage-related lysozyme (muramidase)
MMRSAGFGQGRLVVAAILGALAAAAVAVGGGAAIGQTTTYQTPGATPDAAGLIAGFEGFCSGPYNDTQRNCGTGGTTGNCTIGYGTELHAGPCTAADTTAYPNGVTRQQALDMLQNDANTAAAAVDRNVTVPLTPAQRDALTSFVYNAGVQAFTDSTLLRDLNSGETQAAADQLLRWNRANGQVNQGLINRRTAERCYFLQGTTACGGQLRRARAVTAVPAAVIGAGPAAPATTATAGQASLRVVTRSARAGRPLRITGRGWKAGRVTVLAYVPGVSPYRRVRLHARAGHDGRFSVTWRVSRRIIDGLRWKLTATQGATSAVARVSIAPR